MPRRAWGSAFGAPRRWFACGVLGLVFALTLAMGPDAVGDERILWALCALAIGLLPALAVWLERLFPRRTPVRASGLLQH